MGMLRPAQNPLGTHTFRTDRVLVACPGIRFPRTDSTYPNAMAQLVPIPLPHPKVLVYKVSYVDGPLS